ncbi:uncharacterized protein LOC141533709 [Cotesia typhae]|uniref:uncharacterized protein LOC141533709 n=1 Tax=Cotesia typhae TaxID=2053667 RepID=UPI003D68D893
MPHGKRSRRSGRSVQEGRRRLAQPFYLSLPTIGAETPVEPRTEVVQTVRPVVRVTDDEILIEPRIRVVRTAEEDSPKSPTSRDPPGQSIFTNNNRPAYWTDITRAWKLVPIEVPEVHPPGGRYSHQRSQVRVLFRGALQEDGARHFPAFRSEMVRNTGGCMGRLMGPIMVNQ